ncbi:hypothetical protein [Roseibium sp.]|uniref:hypothetical protein n=1 Tax=Roseibium sp. TaxID=1936156 RepID=UPI003A982BC5
MDADTQQQPVSNLLVAGVALGGLLVLSLSVLLWLRFGERIYFDKIAAGIAGCV